MFNSYRLCMAIHRECLMQNKGPLRFLDSSELVDLNLTGFDIW